MKTVIALLISIMLVSSIVGCSVMDDTSEPDPVQSPTDDTNQDVTEPDDAIDDSNDDDQIVTILPIDLDQPDWIEDRGTFMGQIDSNFMEIEVDGETLRFKYTPDIEWVFAEMLNAGDEVVFLYYEDDDGQYVVEHLETADRAEMIRGVEGTYVGMADNHTIEIEVDGRAMAFAVAEQIVLADFDPGDEVVFDYYEEQRTGRLIVNRIFKR